MTYRRDIDGLRAIAVMAVILTHAGFAVVPAGHAGVDIFFVISGFLIGGIIVTALDEGRFSFREFYLRRARRILPALFAMLIATIPLGWTLMTPDQLRYYGGGAFATLLFLSNVWFYKRIDYFNPDAANDPLVHTWSLGVEEQFYLLAPALIVLLWRLGRNGPAISLAAIAALSFAAALWITPERPMEGFYLIQSRAWELLCGVLAALYLRSSATKPGPALSAILSLAGLLLLTGGMFLIPEDATWPGVLTLIPVVGTLLVLVCHAPGGAAARILGAAPFVAIGLISYSAYLLHQPVLSFAKIAGYEPVTAQAKWAAVLASLLVAWGSWKWIEQPFRNRRVPARRVRYLTLGAITVVMANAIGGHVTEGYPFRMSPRVLAMLDYGVSWPPTYRDCIGGRDEDDRLDPAKACVHGADVPARVAIWGDSHAAVLAQPLGMALKPYGLSVRELTVGSCIPIGKLKNSALRRTEYCAVHNAKMLDYLVRSPEIDVVILNAFWNSYTERRDFDTRVGWLKTDAVIAVPLDHTTSMTDEERLDFMAATFREEVARLVAAGKQVVLLYPLPEAGFKPPEEMARRLWRDGTAPDDLGYPTAAFEDYSGLSLKLLDAAGSDPHIHRLNLSDAFCVRGGECLMVKGGVPMFFNENHYSLAGTAKIIPKIAESVRTILAARD
jgi:peptidoglycan/LPS O-acetylase OafA/YrhL